MTKSWLRTIWIQACNLKWCSQMTCRPCIIFLRQRKLRGHQIINYSFSKSFDSQVKDSQKWMKRAWACHPRSTRYDSRIFRSTDQCWEISIMARVHGFFYWTSSKEAIELTSVVLRKLCLRARHLLDWGTVKEFKHQYRRHRQVQTPSERYLLSRINQLQTLK